MDGGNAKTRCFPGRLCHVFFAGHPLAVDLLYRDYPFDILMSKLYALTYENHRPAFRRAFAQGQTESR